MKIKQLLRVLFFALSIVCMFVIFGFSAQDGPETSSISTEVTEVMVRVANVGKVRIDPNPTSLEFQNLHHLVRKMAHFSIYCILAFCVSGFFITFAWRRTTTIFVSVFVCFFYACMDEIHQSFVAGRGPAFTDVLIDTCGAALGIFLLFVAAHIAAKIVCAHHKTE
ncbi:MAG: VanZ family protein [Ruthenibacterium sp.]